MLLVAMATARDLKDVLKEALTKSGALSEIRARIRAEVFSILQDENEPPVPISDENLLINELIREYLIYNGYLFTESVLLSESGHPNFSFQRDLLKTQLNVKVEGDMIDVPLLYSLIANFTNRSQMSSEEPPQSEKS